MTLLQTLLVASVTLTVAGLGVSEGTAIAQPIMDQATAEWVKPLDTMLISNTLGQHSAWEQPATSPCGDLDGDGLVSQFDNLICASVQGAGDTTTFRVVSTSPRIYEVHRIAADACWTPTVGFLQGSIAEPGRCPQA